jgi:hypothetical protein
MDPLQVGEGTGREAALGEMSAESREVQHGLAPIRVAELLPALGMCWECRRVRGGGQCTWHEQTTNEWPSWSQVNHTHAIALISQPSRRARVVSCMVTTIYPRSCPLRFIKREGMQHQQVLVTVCVPAVHVEKGCHGNKERVDNVYSICVLRPFRTLGSRCSEERRDLVDDGTTLNIISGELWDRVPGEDEVVGKDTAVVESGIAHIVRCLSAGLYPQLAYLIGHWADEIVLQHDSDRACEICKHAVLDRQE